MNRLFETRVAEGRLPRSKELNKRLLAEIAMLSRQDKAGRDWSKSNYSGGYTSYGSMADLHHRFPVFQALEAAISPMVRAFGRAHGWSNRGMQWNMTACFASVMGQGTYHTSHLHPFSTVSGVYFVSVPPGASVLKIEDPRMERMMSAPARELYHLITPKAGDFVLFESWLRHEVPPNRSKESRVSVSFNYSLERQAFEE